MTAAAANPPGPTPRSPKSKTLAAWIALIGGPFGLHRFYLHGWRDPVAWLFPVPTLLGLGGAIRMDNLGQDDHAAWLLIPVLGVMLTLAMLSAIVIGLTPDERWTERFNPGGAVRPTGWGAVIAVIIALMLGGGVLMGTLAFGGQKFFEYQAEPASAAQAPTTAAPAAGATPPANAAR